MGERGRIGIRTDDTINYHNRDLFATTPIPRTVGDTCDNFGLEHIVQSETNVRDYTGGTRRNDRNPDHPWVNPSFRFQFLPLAWQQADYRPTHFKLSDRDIAKALAARRREERKREVSRMNALRSAESMRSPLHSGVFAGAGSDSQGGQLYDVFSPSFRA